MYKRVFLLMLALAPSVARASDICAPQQAAVFDGRGPADDLLLLPARLGTASTRVLLDTGSDWNLIKQRFARALGLRLKTLSPRPYIDVSGAPIGRYVTVSSFTVGPLALAGDFVVIPERAGEQIEHYDATVGARALSSFDVEIDGATGTVILYRPNVSCSGRPSPSTSGWSEIPFSFAAEVPEFDVMVDGRRITAVFDTGASHSLMDIGLAQRLFGIAPGTPGVTARGTHVLTSGKALPLYHYRFKRLGVGDLAFEDVGIVLGDFAAAPFTLGMSEITQLRVYIAFRRRVIHATPTRGAR